MKCKKHPADVSSSVGVCASCLSEKLSAIIAAQAAARAQHQERRRLETQHTAPISFPKSSSPYIAQRKSETAVPAEEWKLHGGGGGRPRFFSTPLVGPTGKVSVEIKKKKNKSIFSSLFSGLFSRSKSGKSDVNRGPIPYPGVPIGSCAATPSWLSAAVPDRRKKTTRTFSVDETTMAAHRKPCRTNRDRGMSPARYSDDEDEHCHGGSSGYSSESSPGWRQTPQRTPATARRGGGRAPTHSKTVSSLNFCLSPLVRAPANQKGGAPPEIGESRVPSKSPYPNATSLCKNRSRKLADIGRYSHNPTH